MICHPSFQYAPTSFGIDRDEGSGLWAEDPENGTEDIISTQNTLPSALNKYVPLVNYYNRNHCTDLVSFYR